MQQKGTYKQKVVQRFAPDAYILIAEDDSIPNLVTGQDIYFNEDVENININGSVDAPVATASFTVNVPRKDRGKYFVNPSGTAPLGSGRPIFELMMEVRIFIK